MSLRLAHPVRTVHVPPSSAPRVGPALDRDVLITSRLVLRPLHAADRHAFVAAVGAGRADLDRLCPLHREGESDGALFERHLVMAAAAAATGKALRLVITPADDRTRILGAINLNSISYGLENRATVNWWLAPAARHRGVACEAAKALFEHALADLPLGRGLQRIDALIDPANIPSLRLAEHLRMRPQPAMYERVMIQGEAKVHQLYSTFALLTPLPASMVEFKPLRGLDAVLRGSIRI